MKSQFMLRRERSVGPINVRKFFIQKDKKFWLVVYESLYRSVSFDTATFILYFYSSINFDILCIKPKENVYKRV